MELSNFDYVYAVFGIIFGIIMIVNPRMFMRNAGYDEESVRTESFMKKTGAVLVAGCIGFAIYIFVKLNA